MQWLGTEGGWLSLGWRAGMPLSGASRHTSAARSGAFLKGQPKLSETITSIPGACDPLADARGPPALPIGVLLMCAALFTISAPISGLCPLGLQEKSGDPPLTALLIPLLRACRPQRASQGPRVLAQGPLDSLPRGCFRAQEPQGADCAWIPVVCLAP